VRLRGKKEPSFPSGHTSTSTAVLVTAAYALSRERVIGSRTATALSLLPLVVGASRVSLDEHWATDVIGGWATGLIVAASCVTAFERERTA
jgi:undecaprenyl-diphosphatase